MKGLTPSCVVLCHFILFFIPLVEALCDYILRALLFRSALPDQTGPPHPTPRIMVISCFTS